MVNPIARRFEKSKRLLIMVVERMIIATLTRLLAMSIVAKRRFGNLNKSRIC